MEILKMKYIYDTISNLPNIIKDLTAMIDSNRGPFFGNNYIITLQNSNNKKGRDEENNDVP